MSKTIFSKKSMLFFSVLVLLFSSCSKDDAVSPDYVGTWSATTTESGMSIKENMTFTTDGVTQLSQMSIPTTNIWIDFLKATATISVNSSTMTTTFTGIGMIPDSNGSITILYPVGSSDFQNYLTVNGFTLSYISKYSVSGNKLTIMTDNNGDGLYTGTDETKVYTKQ